MGLNRTILLLLLPVLILTIPLNAQEHYTLQQDSQNRVVITEDGLSLIQVIYFPAIDNVFRYEIEIEQIQEGQTSLVQVLETTENYFEVSLAAGNYRYRYTSFNRMNLIEGRSDWQDFEIIGTVLPAPESYQPFYGMFIEMPGSEKVITIHGTGFSDKTEFALVRSIKNFDWTEVNIEEQRNTIIPDNITVTENQARLEFSQEKIRQGTYEIFIRNPGGLWVCFGEVRAGYQHRNDFMFGFGLSAMTDFDNFTIPNNYFRFAWFPFKLSFGNFGLGFQMFFEDNNSVNATFNIYYQLPVTERWRHNIRLGVSPYAENTYYFTELGWHELHSKILWFNLGYSIQYFIWKNFYAEAGIDLFYGHDLIGGNSRFVIRPAIGFGFQLGRWGEQIDVARGLKQEQDYSVPVTSPPKGEHILSIGWAPIIPMAGINLYSNRTTGEQGDKYLSVFNPVGFNIRYAYLPHIWGKNKFGYEVESSFLFRTEGGEADFFDNINSLLFGIRYQRVITDSLYLNTRAAFGIANAYKYMEYYQYNSMEMGLAFNFGTAVQYFFWKDLFAQVSLDILLVHDVRTRVQFRPGISIGWQFNRDTETGLRLPDFFDSE